jgi:ribosome-associated translation inhibitor RaiA
MPVEDAAPDSREGMEISSRFRALIEERIERLEKDADSDEAQLAVLRNADHIRRHMRLIAVQRAEARRMRNFIERAGTRIPPPMMKL